MSGQVRKVKLQKIGHTIVPPFSNKLTCRNYFSIRCWVYFIQPEKVQAKAKLHQYFIAETGFRNIKKDRIALCIVIGCQFEQNLRNYTRRSNVLFQKCFSLSSYTPPTHCYQKQIRALSSFVTLDLTSAKTLSAFCDVHLIMQSIILNFVFHQVICDYPPQDLFIVDVSDMKCLYHFWIVSK